MAKRISYRRIIAWTALVLVAIPAGILVSWLRANAAQPRSQTELDATRGYELRANWPFLEIQEKNDAYWAAAIGIPYANEQCGKSVTNAVVVTASHTFSNDLIILLTQDNRMYRVQHPHDLPPAYFPEKGNLIRDGDPLVFNPKVKQVVIRKSESRMPAWTARWMWAWIDYLGVLKLSMSDPDTRMVLDGSSVRVMICRNGLHYDFRRSLNGTSPEPQLAALIQTLQKHSPDVAGNR